MTDFPEIERYALGTTSIAPAPLTRPGARHRGVISMRTKRTPQNAADWFWSNVDRSGGPGACWEWSAGRHGDGYGLITYEGRTQGAHRVAVLVSGREIPHRMLVMHTCDNPPCCNPAHLLVGTYSDNVQDMLRKGRSRYSPVCGKANRGGIRKLTEDEVRRIKSASREGATRAELARRFGVDESNIRLIAQGKTWAHVEV
jgi:hypothetical protein